MLKKIKKYVSDMNLDKWTDLVISCCEFSCMGYVAILAVIGIPKGYGDVIVSSLILPIAITTIILIVLSIVSDVFIGKERKH